LYGLSCVVVLVRAAVPRLPAQVLEVEGRCLRGHFPDLRPHSPPALDPEVPAHTHPGVLGSAGPWLRFTLVVTTSCSPPPPWPADVLPRPNPHLHFHVSSCPDPLPRLSRRTIQSSTSFPLYPAPSALSAAWCGCCLSCPPPQPSSRTPTAWCRAPCCWPHCLPPTFACVAADLQ
jgi:hypothetical protein